MIKDIVALRMSETLSSASVFDRFKNAATALPPSTATPDRLSSPPTRRSTHHLLPIGLILESGGPTPSIHFSLMSDVVPVRSSNFSHLTEYESMSNLA